MHSSYYHAIIFSVFVWGVGSWDADVQFHLPEEASGVLLLVAFDLC